MIAIVSEVDGLKCIILYGNKAHISHGGQEMNPPPTHQRPLEFDFLKLERTLCGLSGLLTWTKVPQSTFISIHRPVFNSCPAPMQITPDIEGYLSTGYSKSTYSINVGCRKPWSGALLK